MIHYRTGNLLESDCDYICHQVNCQGVMGSGIAKQIRDKWPEVYKYYRDRYERTHGIISSRNFLGSIDIVPLYGSGKHVINIYSQDDYGCDGSRFTSYDAFTDALHEIKRRTPFRCTIGFPKNIGCGLGGGNWRVIQALIEETFDSPYRDVYIYELPEQEDSE